MQLKEKIGSLFVVGFDGTSPGNDLIGLVREQMIGGVVLFKRNVKNSAQIRELNEKIIAAGGGRPMIVSIDHEGGRVFRLPSPPFTHWRPMADVGEAFKKRGDEQIAYRIGKKMAEELNGVGFNLNFAPVLDVNTNIKNPVIGDRAFSADAKVVAMLGCELIRGLQENGVMACGKHFPGHGDTNLDSHEALPTVPHTIGRLEAVELIPFRAAMDAGVKSMMTAHVMYPSIDKEMPATLSPLIINGLLRRHLGFDGAVFSDDLQMKALSLKWGLGESARLALMAGCDICLICRDTAAQKEAIEHLISSARTGKLPESVVNAAYLRVEKLLKNAR